MALPTPSRTERHFPAEWRSPEGQEVRCLSDSFATGESAGLGDRPNGCQELVVLVWAADRYAHAAGHLDAPAVAHPVTGCHQLRGQVIIGMPAENEVGLSGQRIEAEVAERLSEPPALRLDALGAFGKYIGEPERLLSRHESDDVGTAEPEPGMKFPGDL